MSNEVQMVHVQDAFVQDNVDAGGAPPNGPNPLSKLHQCLRGRYFKAITVGVVLGIAGALSGFFLLPLKYTSVGQIHIQPTVQKALGTGESAISDYDAFIQTHVMLITSPDVVRDAIKSPMWRTQFPAGVKDLDEEVVDFTENLKAYHPGGTEIIEVRFQSADPNIAKLGADVIMDAYKKRSSSFTTDNYDERIQTLNNEVSRTMEEIATLEKRIELIAPKVYASDLPAIRARTLAESNELKWKIESIKFALASLPDAGTTGETATTRPEREQFSPEIADRIDPRISQLRLDKEKLFRQINNLHLGPNNDYVRSLNAQITDIQAEIDRRTGAAKELYETRDTTPVAVPGIAGGASREQLNRQLEQFEALLKEAEASLAETAQQQRDIESYRAQIDNKKDWLNNIKTIITRETLEQPIGSIEKRIKLYAPNRPVRPDKDRRIAAAAGGGIGGLVIGVGIFALIGFFDRRLRSVADARESLDRSNRILGVLPYLPEDLADPQQSDNAAFCVHHIRTLLQVGGSGAANAVIAVTSASAGDGKTSLVISLGLSYAATGAKTLLIDSDLIGAGLTSRANAIARRKIGSILVREKRITQRQLDEALDAAVRQGKRLGEILVDMGYVKQSELDKALSLQKETSLGLLDVLDGEPLADCIFPGWANNLSILSVGNVGANHAGQISLRAVRRIVSDAREQYDVVLIDCGPILGSLEACIVAAAVDEVIVAVARDQQRPLVEKTFSRLREVGARIAGIVFNRAPREDVESGGYSSTYSSQRLRSPDVRDESKSTTLQRLGPIVRAVAGGQGKQDPDSTPNPGDGV
jgi:Mrp family chromosome partitioning ATPase/uncharacterized protein involved in exopolysaccharide biosynthesis